MVAPLGVSAAAAFFLLGIFSDLSAQCGFTGSEPSAFGAGLAALRATGNSAPLRLIAELPDHGTDRRAYAHHVPEHETGTAPTQKHRPARGGIQQYWNDRIALDGENGINATMNRVKMDCTCKGCNCSKQFPDVAETMATCRTR
jgi:hypothetical protein